METEVSGQGGGSDRGAHSISEYADAAAIFKALGHPLRVRIVCGLLRESCTQTRIAGCLGLPQSTVAQHVEVLRRIAIVEGRRIGAEVVLHVIDGRVSALLRAVCSKGAIPTVEWEGSRSPSSDPDPRARMT